MQVYYPAKPYLRNVPAVFLRGEIARVGFDWSGIGNVLTSSWLNQGNYTALLSTSIIDNAAQVYVDMTGVGTELLQNTVTLDTGEAVRVFMEVTVRHALDSVQPIPACPILLTPANGATGDQLTSQEVTWVASGFATSYKVYLDGELVATTTDTSYTFTDLTLNTEYEWSVIPVGEQGEQESCGFRTFTTANTVCPVLLTPANNATGTDPENQPVTWAEVPAATGYRVYLDDVLIATVTDEAYTFEDLEPSTEYEWKITAMYGVIESSGCGSRLFNTPAVQCPGITVPTNGSSIGEETSTTLLWPEVAEAVSYDVYVWEDGDPQPGTPTANVLVNTYEATGLSLGTTYRVVINTVTAGGHVSQGCGETTFSTDAAPAVIEWQSATFTGDILGPSVTLVAIRSGNTGITASADYDFTEGTALIGPDFIATPGTVPFGVGEVTQNVVVPLVRDYDAEVLTGLPYNSPVVLPDAYWNFAESSPSATFNDLTPNGLDLTLSNGTNWTYDQPDINLSTDGTVARSSGGANYLLRVNINSLIDNGDSFSLGQWYDFNVQAVASTRTLFHIGGAGGSGQFTYCWCYRDTAGKLAMSWHHHTSSGNTFLTRQFALDIPEDQPLWIEAGFDYAGSRAFARLNDGAYVYVTWGVTDSPNALDHTAGRQTYIGIAGRLISSSPSPPNANFGQVEFYINGVVSPDRWPRWNLEASLTFTATLSNPSVGSDLGPVDVTTMTIEAP